MVGLSYAAVPLYDLFCRTTGYGGTTQRVVLPSDKMIERMMTVRFDANVGPGFPWKFEPVERTREVHVGENVIVNFRATNPTDHVTAGTATFNVTPEIAGAYFNKVQCFCFTEQVLQPGQSIDMPVAFFIDPEIAKDKDATYLSQITLSYTFYPLDKRKTAGAAAGDLKDKGKGG